MIDNDSPEIENSTKQKIRLHRSGETVLTAIYLLQLCIFAAVIWLLLIGPPQSTPKNVTTLPGILTIALRPIERALSSGAIPNFIAFFGAYVAIRTYLTQRIDGRYAALHSIFREFLSQDLNFRNEQIREEISVDLIKSPDSCYKTTKMPIDKDIVSGITHFEIQRPHSILSLRTSPDDKTSVVEAVKSQLRKVDPVLLRLIALKLYTVEEIFNIVENLCSYNRRKINSFINRFFLIDIVKFGDDFEKEWHETLRYHIQCDPILTARGFSVYGSCYSEKLTDFIYNYCAMGYILTSLDPNWEYGNKNSAHALWKEDFEIFHENTRSSIIKASKP